MDAAAALREFDRRQNRRKDIKHLVDDVGEIMNLVETMNLTVTEKLMFVTVIKTLSTLGDMAIELEETRQMVFELQQRLEK